MRQTKKTSVMALSIALAMILSYVESQIPSIIPVAGVKMGLANIVVVFTLYKLGIKQAVIISLLRVLLLSIMFGNIVSLAYSIAGAILSLSTMVLIKKTNLFSTIAVSVVGGVMHNVGQIIMACILLSSNLIVYYLPVLIVSGVLSGIIIGVLAGIIVNRINV